MDLASYSSVRWTRSLMNGRSNPLEKNLRSYLQTYPDAGRKNFSQVYLRHWDNSIRQYTFVKLGEFPRQKLTN